MTDDRWQDLIGRLKDDSKVESHETEDLEGRPGTVERIVVATPIGRICLSRTSEPKKIGEKRVYSKRASSTANVQFEYDESEVIHVFIIEREVPETGEWEEIDPKNFQL